MVRSRSSRIPTAVSRSASSFPARRAVRPGRGSGASGGARLKVPLPTAGTAPAICVVDDDATIRESLVRVLAAEGGARRPTHRRPNSWSAPSFAEVACMLLDNRMPGMSGLELHEHLSSRGRCAAGRVPHRERRHGDGRGGDEAGGGGFPVEARRTRCSYRCRSHGAGAPCRRAEADARAGDVPRTDWPAAGREREVLKHVISGRLNKQIAADLDIAEQTVKQHRGRVMEKMEVSSVVELVRVCEGSGLFDVPGEPRARRGRTTRTRGCEANDAATAVRPARGSRSARRAAGTRRRCRRRSAGRGSPRTRRRSPPSPRR